MSNALKIFSPLFLLGLAGCGNSLGTVPVSGKVTVDGQAMEGVMVLFVPTDPEGMPASAQTDASGAFTLTTEINGDGAIPGSYQVALSKSQTVGGADVPDIAPASGDSEDLDAYYKALDEAKSGDKRIGLGEELEEMLIAEKFNAAATSGLTATVEKGGTNEFTFEATSK